MYIYINDGLELAIPLTDHVEFDHEREIPYYATFEELSKVHEEMHRINKEWSHGH